MTKNAAEESLRDIERYSADGGFDTIQVWRTEDGWRYSGPTGAGPEHVRKSGRGPSWTGPIDEKHAWQLLERLREMGREVEVVKCVSTGQTQ